MDNVLKNIFIFETFFCIKTKFFPNCFFSSQQNLCFLIIKIILKFSSPRETKSLTDILKTIKNIGDYYIDQFKRNKDINYQFKRYKDIGYWFKRYQDINYWYIGQLERNKDIDYQFKR